MDFPIRHLVFAAAVSAMLFLSSAAGAAQDPPSDERVREVVEAFEKQRAEVFKGGPAKAKDLDALYSDPLKELDLAQLTPVQIAMLEDAGMLMGTPTDPNSSLRKPAAERAEEFADDPGVEGAVASVMVLQLVGDSVQTPDAEQRRAIFERAMKHPKLEEAIREHGLPIFQAIRFAGDPKLWKEHKDRIVGLESLFDGGPDPRLALQANDYFELLGTILDSNDPQQASQECKDCGCLASARASRDDKEPACHREHQRDLLLRVERQRFAGYRRGPLVEHLHQRRPQVRDHRVRICRSRF